MGRNRWLVLVTALALTLSACNADGDGDDGAEAVDGEAVAADGDGGDGGDGEDITLNLWTFGNFGYDELIEEYQDDHPGITIETLEAEFDAHHAPSSVVAWSHFHSR